MMVEIQIWKAAEIMFSYAFPVSDKSEIPESFRNAIATFYERVPNLSLLDPEVSIKLDAPLNKDTPLYAEKTKT